jgi:lyso-ornithine lipid O-acyltransferase
LILPRAEKGDGNDGVMTWLRIALIIVVIVVVTAVMAPLQIAALLFNWPIARRLPGFWHRIACRLIGIRIHVEGEVEKRRPLMISANHSSWLDILVLGAVADVVYVAKSEVRTWPIFSVLAKLQATIFIEREDPRKTGQQVGEIARRMAGGEIVVLFPEGTTSDGNRVLPLKSSLFGAAAAAIPQAPEGIVYVQPVALAYTRLHGLAMGRIHRPIAAWPGDIELAPHLGGLLKIGALDAQVTFCPSVAYSKDSKRKEVSRTVEDSIREALLNALRDPK